MTVLAWIVFGLVVLALWDVLQRDHAVLRNFPLVGHLRYLFEAVGPELRQYIVTDNDEERPFSRDQRRWVYTSSKQVNSYFGFGSDNAMEEVDNYLIIKHSAFPLDAPHPGDPGYDGQHRIPCAKVLGAWRGRAKAFRPASVVNVSGMSYGSLSSAAVEAISRGCAVAGAMQNTGEGGVSPHHLHGGDVVWQIGTGYFGCRNPDGSFCEERLIETVQRHEHIRALEIKLSQGAKPGLGGVLPAAKISPEIAAARGIPMGRDCISPPRHSAFGGVDEMLDFVERLAERTGLPVGIKSAVGEESFWEEAARLMETTERGVDFIAVDGGEGGTGAGPLVFTDHVSLPFKQGFARVYRTLAERGLHEPIVFIGAGRLGFPAEALFAMALGCDLVSVAREAMLSIGCIQAQRCHTGHCPTGVTTHNRWLVRGLDPNSKAVRLANYVINLRHEMLKLSHACGVEHPALVGSRHFEILDGRLGSRSLDEAFGYGPGLALPSAADIEAIRAIMLAESAPGTPPGVASGHG